MALKDEFKSQGNFLFRNRSYLPLLFIIVGLSVSLYGESQKIEQKESDINEYWELICLFICLIGFAIRVKTVGHTPPNTSGRNTKAGQIAAELNTTGMYSLVRHPLYLGNFFMWLGIAMLAENFWFIIAFILVYIVYYERIMYAEEVFLIDKFKSEYMEWSSRTPAIVPNFKHYRKAKYRFNLKKVFRKEKNGFAAIFALIWLFEFTGDFVEHGPDYFEFDGWFFAALSAAFTYFILKIVKHRKVLA